MIGSPVAILLLGAVLSSRAEEEELEIHERLCAYCVRGEWFEAEAVLREMKRLDARLVAADKLKAVRSNRPSSQNKRVTYVGTRVTDVEEAWLRTEMKKRDMSMSDLIRFALENFLSPRETSNDHRTSKENGSASEA